MKCKKNIKILFYLLFSFIFLNACNPNTSETIIYTSDVEEVKNGEIIEVKERDSVLIKGHPWMNNDLVNLLNTTFSPLILYIFIMLY